MDENLATLWEHVAATVPDHVAVRQGKRTCTYREFERRSAQVAGALQAAGVGEGTKVACFLYNSPELLEAVWGALKVRAIPVNVNYRYRADEVRHLLTDADAEVLVFHSSLADRLEGVLGRLPALRLVACVLDEPGAAPVPGVEEFEDLLGRQSRTRAGPPGCPRASSGRTRRCSTRPRSPPTTRPDGRPRTRWRTRSRSCGSSPRRARSSSASRSCR